MYTGHSQASHSLQSNLVPMTIEKTPMGERSMDIFSRLLNQSIVFINGPISEGMSHVIIAQLLHLEANDPEKDIYVYLNTPGGEVTSGMAIYDTMKFINNPITTVVTGMAASMGSILLCAGDTRYALKNATVMIHQPLGGFQGQASDIEIHAKHILDMKVRLTKLLADRTGIDYEKMVKMCDRDNFIDGEAMVENNLIDKIIEKRSDLG
jgi:ATP-dependent Clp protease protease subunit